MHHRPTDACEDVERRRIRQANEFSRLRIFLEKQ
jgi:hypothetical protein